MYSVFVGMGAEPARDQKTLCERRKSLEHLGLFRTFQDLRLPGYRRTSQSPVPPLVPIPAKLLFLKGSQGLSSVFLGLGVYSGFGVI